MHTQLSVECPSNASQRHKGRRSDKMWVSDYVAKKYTGIYYLLFPLKTLPSSSTSSKHIADTRHFCKLITSSPLMGSIEGFGLSPEVAGITPWPLEGLSKSPSPSCFHPFEYL